MKKIFVLWLCAFSVAFIACNDDKTDDVGEWFQQPTATSVTGTTAEVICQTGFAESVLTTSEVGFTYAALDAEGVAGEFSDAEKCTVDGNILRTRLSGLLPRTTYQAHAFVNVGSSRVLSPGITFTTKEIAPDVTVLEITSLTTLPIKAAEGVYTITYEVINPVQGVYAEAACPDEWIHSFDYSTAGEISFDADENTGAERTAIVTVSYPGAESQQVTVVQRAAEVTPPQPDPTTEIDLTAESAGWPTAYTKASVQVGDYYYELNDVANYGQGIQFKKTSGYMANAEDMGIIRRIELTYNGSGNLALYLGELQHPQGNEVKPTVVDGVYTFDCSGAEYRYFTLSNAASETVSRIQTLKIVCGGDTPDPVVKPTFDAPSYTSLTKNSATISCAYAYTGTGTVSEVYFLYAAGAGAEQRVAAASVQPGTKTAQLSGLSASTRYTFRLCVVIDSEVYTSGTGSFTTYDDGDKPVATTRYPGWPELVPEDAAKANGEYYYAYHICPDFKVGGHNARNYTVCFSATHHCPVWVAAPRHVCYQNNSGRTNAYAKDPDIPSNIQYASKSTGGGCNKGHMLGSAERETTTAVNRQVFYYTNIAPQYSSGYNTGGGGWNTLEDWIDGKVCSDTTYLVIGTYFESYTDGYGMSASPKKIEFGGRSDVSCPTMFYMAVLRTKKGNTGKSVLNCTADELMCAAFVRAHNNSLKGQKVTSKEMMTISDLERLTGHTFFTNVSNAPKSSYSPSDWGL